MSDPWSERAELYRTSTAHSQGPDLDLIVEWAEGCATAIDVATGGGHVARRLREAGLEVVSCDPAPGMQPDVICFAEELPFADRAFDLAVTRVAAHHFADVRRRRRASSAGSRRSGSSSSTRSTTATRLEQAEKLRDPSHVRNYSEAEWRGFFDGRGPRASRRCRSSTYPIELEPWLERTGCTGADAERVRELLADRIDGGDVGSSGSSLRGEARLMAILVDRETRLVVQGLTGSEGRFHGLRNRALRHERRRRRHPGQGRPGRRGHPRLRHRRRRGRRDRAPTRRSIFVPARFAADAVYEAVDAGIGTVVCITEHIPVHDTLRLRAYVRARGVTMIGPNCPGVLSPGKANVGIIPAEVFAAGPGRPRLALGHADLPDRQRAGPARGRQLDDRRHRRRPGRSARRSSTSSTASRPTPRPSSSCSSARSAATRRRRRPATSPRRCRSRCSPTSPASRPRPGRRWATRARSSPARPGTAQAKKEALEAVGIAVGTTPTEVAQLVAERVG